RIDDVAVAVRRANRAGLGVGLRVAHRHTEPECRRCLQAIALGVRERSTRLRWKSHVVLHVIPGAGDVRVEENRGLIVAHVVAKGCGRVVDLGTESDVAGATLPIVALPSRTRRPSGYVR